MDTGKMKNMVVLKDLPSNIIDEAIVVLKPNIKVGTGFQTCLDSHSDTNEYKIGTKDYVINEAQMVISNYLSNMENEKKMKYKNIKSIENKYKILRTILVAVTILGVLNYIFKLI